MERGSEILRLIDRIIGSPLVATMGFVRPSARWTGTAPKRIGVLISAAIGDTIVFSAVLSDLKAAYPGCAITVFCGPSNRSVFALLPQADEVVCVPVTNPIAAVRTIRQYSGFDVWIDTGQWTRISALLTFAAHAYFKVGFRTPGQSRHWLYDLAVDHLSDVHEIKNFRRLVAFLGVSDTGWPVIHAVASHHGHIVIHPFAGGTKPYLKEWPVERWADLVSELTDRGYDLHVTGVRENLRIAEAIRMRCRNPERVIVQAGKYSLVETAQLLKGAALVISVNTGILHLAAALGCKLIGLHGPTSAKRWGPLCAQAIAIQSPLSCSPCLNLGFDYGCGVDACMRAIDVSRVLEAALASLENCSTPVTKHAAVIRA